MLLQSLGRGKLEQFEEELTYGVSAVRVDTATGETQICTLYLHEQYPIILVCVSEARLRVLNMQHCRLSKLVPHLERLLQINCYLEIKDGVEQLLLLFSSQQHRNRFANSMDELIRKCRSFATDTDSSILRIFIEADTNHNGRLSLVEIEGLMRKLRVEPNAQIKAYLKESKKSMLTEHTQMGLKEFEVFAKLMACKVEMLKLFEGLVSKEPEDLRGFTYPVMSRKQFGQFLVVHQYINSLEEVEEITDKVFEGRSGLISFYNFCVHLLSKENSIISKKLQETEFDEDHPLLDYYCLSSHNACPSGNQLTNASRVERYIEDLEDGVRCLELDVHNDGDTPIIKRGYISTEPILFSDIIQSIARFCQLEANHTPIILCLENHCSKENKQRIARILVKHFGNKLLTMKGDKFPNLRQLRGRIIVNNVQKEEGVQLSNQQNQMLISERQTEPRLIQQSEMTRRLPASFAKKKAAFLNEASQFRKLKKESLQQLERVVTAIEGLKTTTANKVASQLLSITAMFSNGRQGEINCWESIHLSYQEALSLLKKDRVKLQRQAKGSWARVYPSGTQTAHSNYNPLPLLEVGVQLVALNTQYKGKQTNILYSFFAANQKQRGYLLKPSLIGQAGSKPNAAPICIRVTVLSCHSLVPYDPLSQIPMVKVNIGFFGSQTEAANNTNFSLLFPFTQTIQGNCYNPTFRETREFNCKVSDPFFGILYFEVPDCGQAAVPVRLIRPGFRTVQLRDNNGRENGSLILVHVEMS